MKRWGRGGRSPVAGTAVLNGSGSASRLCNPDPAVRKVRPAGPVRTVLGLEAGIAAQRRTVGRVESRLRMEDHSYRIAAGRMAVVGVGSLVGVEEEQRRRLQELESHRRGWGPIDIDGFGRIGLGEDNPAGDIGCIGLTL